MIDEVSARKALAQLAEDLHPESTEHVSIPIRLHNATIRNELREELTSSLEDLQRALKPIGSINVDEYYQDEKVVETTNQTGFFWTILDRLTTLLDRIDGSSTKSTAQHSADEIQADITASNDSVIHSWPNDITRPCKTWLYRHSPRQDWRPCFVMCDDGYIMMDENGRHFSKQIGYNMEFIYITYDIPTHYGR